MNNLNLQWRIGVVLFVMMVTSLTVYFYCDLAINNSMLGIILMVVCIFVLLMVSNWKRLSDAITPYVISWYQYNMSILLTLRWALEVITMSAIHSSIPMSIDEHFSNNFKNAMGMALGTVIAVITGRDITWIIHLSEFHREKNQKTTILIYILKCVIALGVFSGIFLHCSVFLNGPIYIDTNSLRHRHDEALMCSRSYVIQLMAVGSIYSSYKFKGWKEVNEQAIQTKRE